MISDILRYPAVTETSFADCMLWNEWMIMDDHEDARFHFLLQSDALEHISDDLIHFLSVFLHHYDQMGSLHSALGLFHKYPSIPEHFFQMIFFYVMPVHMHLIQNESS